MVLRIINGNILMACTKYIAHQINCVTTTTAGLSKSLFAKYPYANVYTDGTKRVPGKIIVRGNDDDHRLIINMAGQFRPGKPTNKETTFQRLEWFKSCLEEIKKIPDLESIAFPHGIGCGLAGGDWLEYARLLDEFARTVKADVYIFKL